jgi:hypothetical protein
LQLINIVIIIIIIYTYISETNNVPREYIVAAILLLLFMLPISLVPVLALLCFYVCTFRSMCSVHNMAVFCSSLTSWFPGMLLTYFLNDFEIVPLRVSFVHTVIDRWRWVPLVMCLLLEIAISLLPPPLPPQVAVRQGALGDQLRFWNWWCREKLLLTPETKPRFLVA